MDVTYILQQTILGLAIGLTFSMVAIGFSLTFGLSKVINLAHGAFYALGTYLTFAAMHLTNNFGLSLIVSTVSIGLASLLVEKILVNKLYGKDIDLSLIVTFSTLLVVSTMIKMVWGLDPKSVSPPQFLTTQIYVAGTTLPVYYLFLATCSLVLFIFVWAVINKTMLGRVIKAGSEDKDRVETLGINMGRVFTINYVFGGMLAALGGGLMAPLISIEPSIGSRIILLCFAVVVVGGMGSIFGTMLAGIIIGLSISYVTMFNAPMSEAAAYLVMALFLLIRPKGLLGTG
ncbi:MAG: branched-chain amino acid ABC transporter permease [Candidatus Bathyarchaeia archaeon]|nr:branched-chain amino acid ABC transporter permease [Candidatus Bathyarchaeota archaeon]